jgi:hypothetical protein
LSQAHGAEDLRGDGTHGGHQEIGVDISWTSYILVKYRFRNSVKDMHALPGADIDSDHKLLLVKICTRLKKIVYIYLYDFITAVAILRKPNAISPCFSTDGTKLLVVTAAVTPSVHVILGGPLFLLSFGTIPKEKPRWNLEKFYTQPQRVQDNLEEKLGAIGS